MTKRLKEIIRESILHALNEGIDFDPETKTVSYQSFSIFSKVSSPSLASGLLSPWRTNSMETKAEGWYTMQGVKIQKPVKAGMYILNGRKVIVR